MHLLKPISILVNNKNLGASTEVITTWSESDIGRVYLPYNTQNNVSWLNKIVLLSAFG